MVKLRDSIEPFKIRLGHYRTELIKECGIISKNISDLCGIEFQRRICNVLKHNDQDHNMKLDMEESTI